MAHKRILSWSYSNTQNKADAINSVNFSGPIVALYNWEAWSPPELNGRLTFQPMCHGKDRIGDPNWNNVENTTQNSTIYFFNEPERANTTPEEAADLWRQHMLGTRSRGNRIFSPGCASDDNGKGWLSRFMQLVGDDARPDGIAAHWYGEDAGAMQGFLNDMHNQYGLPIIVTEWACTSHDYNTVLNFTVDMANWMDGTDWIEQYALFGATLTPADDFVSPAAQLMNPDGSFTDLGYKYMYDVPMHT